jgi:hypothetical protein
MTSSQNRDKSDGYSGSRQLSVPTRSNLMNAYEAIRWQQIDYILSIQSEERTDQEVDTLSSWFVEVLKIPLLFVLLTFRSISPDYLLEYLLMKP